VIGMFGMAVITGVIFVRFSRPTARITVDYGRIADTEPVSLTNS